MKKNTAIICLSPNFGGMEINAINMAKKLAPFTKVFVIANERGHIANVFKEDTSSIILKTIKFKFSLSLNIVLQAREYIIKNGIKNVIFYGASELKSLYFSFLGLDINLIVIHSTTKSTPKTDWFHRLIYSKVNYHIAISKHLHNNVFKIIPMNSNNKSIMIYSGMPIKKLEKVQNKQLTLIHTGRIAEGKGQLEAMNACNILYENDIDFKLFIVGGYENKEYEEFFLGKYSELPYKEKVVLTGYTNKVDEYLAQSDIFLFPSHGEGFGKSIAEALSFGLVCIVFGNTSFFEFEELGFHMHLAKNLELKDLEKKLLFVALNLQQEIENSSKNIELANKLFNETKEVDSYLEVLI